MPSIRLRRSCCARLILVLQLVFVLSSGTDELVVLYSSQPRSPMGSLRTTCCIDDGAPLSMKRFVLAELSQFLF